MQIAGMDLVVGRTYDLTVRVAVRGNQGTRKVKRKMKLVGIYPHHAQFERRGIRRSYGYWELEKLLKGEAHE